MEQNDDRKHTPTSPPARQAFSKMSLSGKLKHLGKVIVCLLTFGFAFPHIFSD